MATLALRPRSSLSEYFLGSLLADAESRASRPRQIHLHDQRQTHTRVSPPPVVLPYNTSSVTLRRLEVLMPRYKRTAEAAQLDVALEPSIAPETQEMLTTLRNMWEFASLMQYIFLLGHVVKIDDDFDIDVRDATPPRLVDRWRRC